MNGPGDFLRISTRENKGGVIYFRRLTAGTTTKFLRKSHRGEGEASTLEDGAGLCDGQERGGIGYGCV